MAGEEGSMKAGGRAANDAVAAGEPCQHDSSVEKKRAGEEGSCITGCMAADPDVPAKDAVAAGVDRLLKRPDHASFEKRAMEPCITKRKAEDDEEQLRTTKRKVEAIGCSSVQEANSVPVKKMTRLPQQEVALILGLELQPDRVIADLKALHPNDPDLILSRERTYRRVAEDFSKYQAWIRSEYVKNGYVEVDDDFLAKRAQVRAVTERHREDALKTLNFSEEDADLKRLVTNRWN